ncbi:IBR domain [Fusarium oxysporum f. sp. vasinfectum]|nr:IBR domain [Fusarium oxysporum f. sp. vasinfectum]
MDYSDDPRLIELGSIEAIYPEIRRPDAKDPFTFEIDLPVEPAAPVTVTFPAASAPAHPGLTTLGQATENAQPEVDSLEVSYLPPLRLRVRLPEGYPADAPPDIVVSTIPQWLSRETIKRLEDDGPRLWDEIGRDMVAFTYIDHIQRAAEDVFGTISPGGTLQVDPEHKLAVLDHDIKAKKAAFEKETFDCGVCLDPKKGSKCHRMLDCRHIFCIQCLQDFYNDAINEGNLSTVRCLSPNCAKKRAASKDTKKHKVAISPSELLQIGLSEEMVKRYVTLKYKTELESDKNTIYCPRQWCNGAARSKRHKKPEGLEFAETAKSGKRKNKETFSKADLLSICEDCGFAFCGQCYQSWHGEFVRCAPRRDKGELSEEEKASLEYLQLHTSPCPTCNAPAQKTHGCNHMICSRCDTHFCYLCSSWLDPVNPYQHYNQLAGGKVTSCYMRLWELEGGDGDDVGLGFVGGRGPVADAPAALDDIELMPLPEVIESDDSDGEDEANAQGNNRPLGGQGQGIEIAREGPLVIRLVDNQARDGRRAIPPAAPDAPQQLAGRGHNGPPRVNQRQPQLPQQAQGQDENNQDGLDPAQEAWVRRFVQMALNDEEDLVDGDSDEDDGNWIIR